MKKFELKITKELEGVNVKNILFSKMGLSAKIVSMLKRSGGIILNGEVVTVRKIVKTGDLLEVIFPKEKSDNIVPSAIELDIIYEDEDVLVVNKPFNMPTHPSFGHYENTLANAVMYRYKDGDFVFRAITRLDKDTSGVVLIAKNRIAAYELCKQMSQRKIKKEYMAICCGKLPQKNGIVEAPIKREKESVIKRIVADDGQYARTDYEVIGEKDGYSLVKLMPQTGRTHQIRVHMAHLGTPIFGDFIYGDEIKGERTRLHCFSLEFEHPSTKKMIRCEAKLPKDFEL